MGGSFDLESKKQEIKNLENQQNEENFWTNFDQSNQINMKLNNLRKTVNTISELETDLTYLLEVINSSELDDSIINEIEGAINNKEQQITELELQTFLNQPHDELDCYLEIHPGAGGTESCDWALMLSRMYQKYCELTGLKFTVVDEQKGDEAGIKNIMMQICGPYAYGYLKNENGVHRLVRISPFDSNSRRHTSFAAVSVTPKFNQEINIEIKDSDLKIDVYRSSGAGGQSVNTTDSAVRITHLPSKIVVTCQNERSQLNNKEQALKILKDKLYQLELESKEVELKKMRDNGSSIDFGSQIRSYVLEPYTLVKDYRSGYESSQVTKVLDGEIKELIESVLKKG